MAQYRTEDMAVVAVLSYVHWDNADGSFWGFSGLSEDSLGDLIREFEIVTSPLEALYLTPKSNAAWVVDTASTVTATVPAASIVSMTESPGARSDRGPGLQVDAGRLTQNGQDKAPKLTLMADGVELTAQPVVRELAQFTVDRVVALTSVAYQPPATNRGQR